MAAIQYEIPGATVNESGTRQEMLPGFDANETFANNTDFVRLQFPNSFVGPMVLRQMRRPFYPFDSSVTASTGNRRRRVICSSA